MKRTVGTIATVVCLIAGGTSSVLAATAKPGVVCKKVGVVSTYKNVKLTCVRKGSKSVWVAVTPVSPQPAATLKLRIVASSNSDWSNTVFTSTVPNSLALISASGQGSATVIDARQISLSFPLTLASSPDFFPRPREAAEFSATFDVAKLVNGLSLSMTKGSIGTTVLDFYNGSNQHVGHVFHSQNQESNNEEKFFLSGNQLLGTGLPQRDIKGCDTNRDDNASTLKPLSNQSSNPNVLIAQDNLWFHASRDGTNDFSSKQEPAIGYYNSSSMEATVKRIDIAADNGIDALSQEWISPLGTPGSMEDLMDDVFLAAPNLCRIRWALFYDLNLRMESVNRAYINQAPNFADPQVVNTFVNDFVHFAKKYFSHPQYLKVDDRPLVEIWATWNFGGTAEQIQSAVSRARDAVKQLGYDVFIVGDEQSGTTLDKQRVALWDATTSFIPIMMPGSPGLEKDNGTKGLAEVTQFVDKASSDWVQMLKDVVVKGTDRKVGFQPGFAPQYDDTIFRAKRGIKEHTSLLAMSKGEIRALAQVALKYAQPVGTTGRNLIWIGTWNGFPESTQIEPTKAGSDYPGGNIGYDILNSLVEVFGSKTFGN